MKQEALATLLPTESTCQALEHLPDTQSIHCCTSTLKIQCKLLRQEEGFGWNPLNLMVMWGAPPVFFFFLGGGCI